MLAFIVLAIIDIIILSQTGKSVASDGKEWTIYGTMGCGWTRKQLEYMKKNGKPFKFIDCDNGGNCSDKSAFPTTITPDGEEVVGFKKF